MYKAAVIGNYDSIYGFASAGMNIVPVSSGKECANEFVKMLDKDYGVLFVTENYAEDVIDYITKPIPVVMFIPSQGTDSGYAKNELHKMVEKAAGADLLQ